MYKEVKHSYICYNEKVNYEKDKLKVEDWEIRSFQVRVFIARLWGANNEKQRVNALEL